MNFNIKCIYKIKNYHDIREEITKLLNNNEEIKNNSILYINNKRINRFQYIYQKEGIYILKILFIKSITKTDKMFSNCSSLTSLDLSYFNTNFVKDMSDMFSGCSSLTSLNTIDKRLLKKWKNH